MVIEPHLTDQGNLGRLLAATLRKAWTSAIPHLPQMPYVTPYERSGKMGVFMPEGRAYKLPAHTHMTWTMTPMPDTASRSTAFSMACEMVSNRCSGSCQQSRSLSIPRTSGPNLVWLLNSFSRLKDPSCGPSYA